jgi:tetratricopeptide (TPR) repeat protein
VDGLKEDWKGFCLNEAGYDLRALGRLAEAAQPTLAALEARIAQDNWRNAARNASNLSELYLTLGDVQHALDAARQSVELADRSGEVFERMARRTTLADVLHQAGQLAEAEAAFREAEEMQKARQPEFPLLYSLWGFRYCDLLLSQGKVAEVQSRAGTIFEWRKLPKWNPVYDPSLDIALDHLSLGRAHTLSLSGRGQGESATAATYLDRAVDSLRQAGQQDVLPLGLLARAELRRVTGALDKARRDLDEAFSIASRGGMKLHEADCHLAYARLYLAEYNLAKVPDLRKAEEAKDKAREHWSIAKRMIDEMGYHRRDAEVKELEAQV